MHASRMHVRPMNRVNAKSRDGFNRVDMGGMVYTWCL